MQNEKVNNVFFDYLGFRVWRFLRYFNLNSPVLQSVLVTILFTAFFIIGSSIDGTLFMAGKDIGFFEHPTVWAFLLLNIFSPYFIYKSLTNLLSFLAKNYLIDSPEVLGNSVKLFYKMTSKKTNFSNVAYILITIIGLICFSWNSFQNQAPLEFLGFDFWDSFNHPFGYWISRVYKFYQWVFFLPALVHIHISILFVLYKLLKQAETNKIFIIKPYNQDEYAGVGVIIKIAINPTLPVLILGSLSVIAAFFIHGKVGVTPILGLVLITLLFLLAYLVPAIQLRKIIKAEKKRQLAEIAEKQNFLYYAILKNSKTSEESNNIETLNSLSLVFEQLKSISVWPYWKTIVKIIGILNIPVLISTAKSVTPFFIKLFNQ